MALPLRALTMAGLDAIKRELDPGEPLDADIYIRMRPHPWELALYHYA